MAGDPRAVVGVRRVVLALVAALCGVLVAWHFVRYSAPTAAFATFVLVSPWAVSLRGLLHGRRPAYARTTLLTLPYIGYGLMDVLANPGARTFAGATALLGFTLFFALVAYLRVSRLAPPARSARTAP